MGLDSEPSRFGLDAPGALQYVREAPALRSTKFHNRKLFVIRSSSQVRLRLRRGRGLHSPKDEIERASHAPEVTSRSRGRPSGSDSLCQSRNRSARVPCIASSRLAGNVHARSACQSASAGGVGILSSQLPGFHGSRACRVRGCDVDLEQTHFVARAHRGRRCLRRSSGPNCIGPACRLLSRFSERSGGRQLLSKSPRERAC